MYDAVLSSGGVPSLSVTLCESVTGPPMAKYKIDGVSLISNIEYSAEEGIRVWRAYGVGPGRLISTDPPSLDGIPSLTVVQANPSSFSTVKRRTTTSDTRGVVQEEQSDEDHASTTSGEMLFTCPEETCTKTFLRHSSMMRHLDCGKHQCTLEHETLLDKAALEYAEQLEGHSTMVPVVSMASRGPSEHPQSMGWALKSSGSRRARFTQAQKSYLTAKFRLEEQTGHKADPASVSRSMMFAKDSSGSRLFTSDDFLTANQITSFFSRLASKKSLADDQQQDDIEVAAHEAGIEEIVNEVMYELVPKHPIIFDVYNLCELASKRKLNNNGQVASHCIIQYSFTGDPHPIDLKPHKNAKDKSKGYTRTRQCTKDALRGMRETESPSGTFHSFIESKGGLSQVRSLGELPRSAGQFEEEYKSPSSMQKYPYPTLATI
ncbi:hypothetical protein QZH41_006680 [Actinostola sp. cb2023]|nr:hypothetical protein QZH41_006680 [Actinostola sp. cb2023]